MATSVEKPHVEIELGNNVNNNVLRVQYGELKCELFKCNNLLTVFQYAVNYRS